MIYFEHERLMVRQAISEDALLISKWLSDPEVLEYYEGRDCPHDEQMVRTIYFAEEDETAKCIVEYDGHPIGYVQFYQLGNEERVEYGYTKIEEVIYGTDQFIGEPIYWNKGIGSILVKSMVNFLLMEKGADRIVMDPQSVNYRAISCYEKCGLIKVKLLEKHEKHEGEMRDCWLMEYTKKSHECEWKDFKRN